MTVTVLLSGEPSMVKMGRLVKDERGIAHFGCAAHRLEKTAERFYKHTGVEASLTRAKTVVTFIHIYRPHTHTEKTNMWPSC